MNDEPETPPTPVAVEDSVYQAIVNEYVGLQRAGVDPASAALITAAHLVMLGKSAAQQGTGGV